MSTIRYRKNINCLTTDELHDYREALAAMFELPPEDEHSFEMIAGLHGVPLPYYCIHSYPGFLTWHRAYMEAFENALQFFDCDIMLPFWDWSSGPSTGVPAACSESTYVNRDGDSVPNPLFAGPLPDSIGGGMTNRRTDIDSTSFDDIATGAQYALTRPTFDEFQRSLNGPHGRVHGRVRETMGSILYSSYDPIFFLHHSNVDRIWAQWQLTHSEPLPAGEASFELEPFNKTFSSGWKTGTDVATTAQLGYRYTNFCIFIDWRKFWEIIRLRFEPIWFKKPIQFASLVFRSRKMPLRSMEIRVFINDPDSSAETATQGNPHFAGSIGLFGLSPSDDKKMQMKRRPNERFDLEMDISKALIEHGSSGEEVSIKLVPVGLDGKAIAPENASIEGIDVLMD